MSEQEFHYSNAEALRRAVTDRARAGSASISISTEKRLRQFAYGRFLARVFADADSDWVLKGGVALLGRLTDARHSRDIDLARRSSSSDEAVVELENLVQCDMNDFFEFRMGRASRSLSGTHEGVTVPVVAYLGLKEFSRFNVDIVIDVDTTVEPEIVRPISSIDVPGLVDVPWRTYPLVDHIADKFAAMVETHGSENYASSRYRDLVDVVLIAVSVSIDGKLLRRAIMTELRLRQIVVEAPLKLPDSKAWRAGYGALLSELPNVDIDFEEARAIAVRVFSIVDNDQSDLMWNPAIRQWQA